MQRLANKIVFITGASSGIGKASAEQFAAAGAHVIITGRRLEKLTELAKQLEATYSIKALALPLDVSQKTEVQTTIDSLDNFWKNIDVLVNNAGLALTTDLFQEGDTNNWDTMIDTNIKGVLYVARAILPGMLERKKGHIINVSSIAGYEHYMGGNIYSATKHAVCSLSKSMQIDLLGKNIRISDIAPGLVSTEFSQVRWNDKDRADDFYNSVKALKAEDIADAVVYCANCPEHMDVSQMVIVPTIQASTNHVYKEGDEKKVCLISKNLQCDSTLKVT